ncbi:hypothetical protein RPPX_21930 [Pseudomonas putida S12]|uniref:Uncharacterized protein n=1 Tax=Pseudomonas putida S12 TaxID=1215087 RepID=A0AA34RYZ2_PSEPU|nr:hypothetical protein RPPX_21930 [Pseudomonas putida S12]
MARPIEVATQAQGAVVSWLGNSFRLKVIPQCFCQPLDGILQTTVFPGVVRLRDELLAMAEQGLGVVCVQIESDHV